jgi:hypothetical protein
MDVLTFTRQSYSATPDRPGRISSNGDLPVYDFREALRPPTRLLPIEEEEYEEEG